MRVGAEDVETVVVVAVVVVLVVAAAAEEVFIIKVGRREIMILLVR